MATLKQQIEDARKQITGIEEQTIPGTKIEFPMPARAYVASGSNFDSGAGFESDVVHGNTTFRSMWRTQDAAIQQNKVITTRLPDAQIAKGLAQSPSVTSTKLTAVPDVTVAAVVPGHSGNISQGGGQVQISWHISAGLSSAAAQASFALFRDGVQIGPTVYAGTPNNNGKFSVAQNFIDTPGSGLHSYAVYWATSAGTLTADSANRYIHALALRPQ
jgi:hypothetical protein